MSKKRGLPVRVKMRHDAHFVEDLAARHETPVGKMAPLSTIEPDPNQPRTLMGNLDELVASVKDRGVLEPILVRRIPDDEDTDGSGGGATYRIISGERRYRASLQAGLYEIPVIEMEVTETEALEIALIENLQRKDLTPFEEAEGYKALADRYDYTHEEISDAVGKSRTVVTESLALLQMSPRVRDAVQALGITTKSVLLEVLKAGSDEDQIRLLEEVASHGLNRDDLRRRLRRRDEKGSRSKRRKPYSFKFRAPDKSFTLNLKFRQSEVDRADLIGALEQILGELRAEANQDA